MVRCLDPRKGHLRPYSTITWTQTQGVADAFEASQGGIQVAASCNCMGQRCEVERFGRVQGTGRVQDTVCRMLVLQG